MGIILEAEHLTYGYDEKRHAIEDLSIAFEEGKTTAILGANGAGKSTLFLHLNGILQPEHGEVRFRGQPISYKKAGLRQLRSKVGIVFQNPDDQLFSASVYQDISFGAVNMGLPSEEVHRRVNVVMEQIGITYLKDRPTHSLSFGQKKRVAFAGIMVMQPEVIILDEPTAGLDPVGVSELMHLLQDVCRQQNTTIILSTHDIDVVPDLCRCDRRDGSGSCDRTRHAGRDLCTAGAAPVASSAAAEEFHICWRFCKKRTAGMWMLRYPPFPAQEKNCCVTQQTEESYP